MIFVTSDTHFCHDKEFIWKGRGFSSVEEMDEIMVERWNKTVKNSDTVYHLGDIMLTDNQKGIEYLKRLRGNIVFVIGNHDTEARIKLILSVWKGRVEGNVYAMRFKAGKTPFYVSHFPTISATLDKKPFSQHIIGLHGHTHSKTHWIDPKNPFMYDAGVDSHNFAPVSIDEIVANVKKKWEQMT